MALDLSTVSEPTYEETESSSRYVLLSSDTLTISGSNEILFEVSQSGQLFLAQFFVENMNGTCILRRRSLPLTENGSEVDDVEAGEATNLSLSKPLPENTCASRLVNSSSATQSEEVRLVSTMMSSPVDGGSISTALTPPVNNHSVQPIMSNGGQNTAKFCTGQESLRISSSLLSGIVSKLLEQRQSSDIVFHNSPSAAATTTTGGTGEKNDLILSGHNLSELSRFVDRLREFRHLVGLSQCQLSTELARHFRNESLFSQPLLSRFEKLNVTVRAAFRLLPYLKTWLSHAEKQRCACTGPENNFLDGSGTPLGACQTQDYGAIGSHQTTSVDRPIRSVGRARLSVLAARMVHSATLAAGQLPNRSEHQRERLGSNTPLNSMAASCHSAVVSTGKPTHLSDSSNVQILRPGEAGDLNEVCSATREGAGSQLAESLSAPNTTASCQLTLAEHSRPWRRKRTRFTPAALATLSLAFSRTPHPSSAQLTRLATETGHNRESIRIWFGNRRQLTNQTKSIKKQTTP